MTGCRVCHKGYADAMTEHQAPPHDDDETPLGDTPEAKDELSPVDLPPDHPGRQEAERDAGGVEGTTKGNT